MDGISIILNGYVNEPDNTPSSSNIKVHMKPNLFLHSCKMYRLKCTIPKFEMARTKIDDFTSAESWAILPRKMVRGLDRVCCEIPWL